MFAANGILFNHESPIRGETFVSRKITRAAAQISLGFQEKRYLGNHDAQRDWGHARDYVVRMWLILQAEKPEDFVLTSGKTTKVSGIDEIGIDSKSSKLLIEVDARYFRPTELEQLLGDPSKAREKLGWKHKYSLEDLVKEIVQADLVDARKDKYLHKGGFVVNTVSE